MRCTLGGVGLCCGLGGGVWLALALWLWVFEEEADSREGAGAQLLVDVCGVGDGEGVGYQGADVDLFAGDQVDEAFEVAAFGPADVAGRVVEALQLVAVVVPAGSVRPGEPDVEF